MVGSDENVVMQGLIPFAMSYMDCPIESGNDKGKKQGNDKKQGLDRGLVGMAGFEPATSTSRTWRASQAALHPENQLAAFIHKIVSDYQIIKLGGKKTLDCILGTEDNRLTSNVE